MTGQQGGLNIMKTAKEFIERLQSDEDFAGEYAQAVKAKQEAGINDIYDTVIPVAEGFGYEVTRKDIDEIQASLDEELTAEELGKVAGGSEIFTIILTLATISGLSVAGYYFPGNKNKEDK